MQEPKLNLLNRAHALGLAAQAAIRGYNGSLVGEVPRRGLMIGIALVEDLTPMKPRRGGHVGAPMGQLLQHGVPMIPCSPHCNKMRVMPSLAIPRKRMFKVLGHPGRQPEAHLKYPTHRHQRVCYDV